MISSNINSMQAHQKWMSVSANSIANVNTEGFKAADTVIGEGPKASVRSTEGATDLSKEMSDQIVIAGGFSAQASAVKTQDEMLGSLLDMKG